MEEIPFDKENWQQTPHMTGRVATDDDVQKRRAVFTINPRNGKHIPIDIKIPSLAYHIDQVTNSKSLVIVIQAEQCDDKKVAGIRYSDGKEGACLFYELEFIENYPE